MAGPGAGGCVDLSKDVAAGPRHWDWGHLVLNLDAQVSAGRGAGRGGCDAILVTGRPGNALGSAGIRDEVRPEAPDHWARGRARNRPALLQSGPGPGEVVTPGRGPAML